MTSYYISGTRIFKAALGLLTAWPLIYAIWFGSVVVFATRQPPEALLSRLFFVHGLTTALIVALLTFYLAFLFRTQCVPPDRKPLWAIALFFGSVLAMPVFFVTQVWPEKRD